MSGVEVLKKSKRYDGRTKKRKWEERRSDYVKTTSEEQVDDKKTKIENTDRVKRRKYVLMLGYSGVDYYGMQRYVYGIDKLSQLFEWQILGTHFQGQLKRTYARLY